MAARTQSVRMDEARMARLAAAKAVLGTSGLTDTMDAAFEQVVREDRKRRLIERFKSPDGFDDAALAEVLAQRKPT